MDRFRTGQGCLCSITIPILYWLGAGHLGFWEKRVIPGFLAVRKVLRSVARYTSSFRANFLRVLVSIISIPVVLHTFRCLLNLHAAILVVIRWVMIFMLLPFTYGASNLRRICTFISNVGNVVSLLPSGFRISL